MSKTHFTSIETGDYGSEVENTSTAQEMINVCDVSARVQSVTASGTAVTAGMQSIQLNNDATAMAVSIADLADHPGFFVIKQLSGSCDHVVTASAGTFDGTNSIATFGDTNDCLMVYIDSAGNGTIIENVGTVALS